MRADQLGYNAHMGAFDLFMDIIGLFSFVRHLFNFIDD
jgi:FtsH-binding integral membrane protein